MVLSVEKIGIKQTAQHFHTTRATVRKWLRRFENGGFSSLADRSRRPLHSPLATPQRQRERLVRLKRKYKRLGAEEIKTLEGLLQSPKTIRKIWRQEGVSSRKRRKKHQTKQNLRAVKKNWALFEQIDEDTKVLLDIPEYWTQVKQKGLPSYQYSARDVTSGLFWWAFADELSLTYASRFATYLNRQLLALGVNLSETTRQTDGGSEFIGSPRARKPSAYTLAIQSVPGQIHMTIPPGAYRFQSDVETLHNLVEIQFYEIETFLDRPDFLNKAYSYQLFFNLRRPNSYKEHQTPWQIAHNKNPRLPIEVAMIPPVYLEDLLDLDLEKALKGGHHVSTVPYRWCPRAAGRATPLLSPAGGVRWTTSILF
jgi:transposase